MHNFNYCIMPLTMDINPVIRQITKGICHTLFTKEYSVQVHLSKGTLFTKDLQRYHFPSMDNLNS